MAETKVQLPNGQPAIVDSKGKVHMRDSSGNIFRVPSELVAQQATLEGWHIANEADLKDFDISQRSDEGLAAGAEAAVAGALDIGLASYRTAGLLAGEVGVGIAETIAGKELPEEKKRELIQGSPFMAPSGREVIAGGYGMFAGDKAQAEYEQAARERALANPVESTVGNIAGSFVGAGGLLAPVGGALQRTTMAAVEGWAQGAAQVDEDSYIMNVPLTAERMLAGGAMGAVISGGAEFGLGALLGGRAKPGAATGLEGLPKEEFQTKLAMKVQAGEVSPREARDLARRYDAGLPLEKDFLQETMVDNTLKAVGISPAAMRKGARTPEGVDFNADKITRDVLEAKLDDGTPVFAASEGMPLIGPEGTLASRAVQKLDEWTAELNRARKQLDDFAVTKPALMQDVADQADIAWKEIERELVTKVAANPLMRGRAAVLREHMQLLRDDVGPNPTLGALEQARQNLSDTIYPKGRGYQLPPAIAENKIELAQMERILEKHVRAAQDKVLGAMPDPPGGPGYIGELAAKAHSMETVARAATAKEWQARIGQGSALPEYVIGGSIALTGDPGTGLAMLGAKKAVDFIRNNRNQVMAVAAHRMAKAFNKDVTKAVKAGVHGKDKVFLPKRLSKPLTTTGVVFATRNEDRRKAYIKRVQETMSFVGNPEAANRKLATATGPLMGGAPKTAGMLSATAMRAQLFLASKIPKGVVSTSPLSPTKLRTEASDDEIARYAVYWEAVMNPRTVLRDLAKGALVSEQVEALKAVYPALFADIQQMVLLELASRKDEVPYDRRMQLDMLLGLNGAGEPSLSPMFQNTLSMAAAIAEAEMAPTGPPSAAKKPNSANARNRMSTLSDRIESDT